MKSSGTADQDALARWEAIVSGDETEVDAEAAGDPNPSTEIADDASPAQAEATQGTGPEGTAVVETEVQPEGAATAPSPAPADPTPAPQTQDIKPWKPRADGRVIDIPGAVEANGYVAIPLASMDVLQKHLAHRETWMQREQGYKAQLAAKGEKETRADVLIEHFAALLEGGREAVLAWLDGFEANKDGLLQKMEVAALRAQLDGRTKVDEEGERAARLEAYTKWKPEALQGAVSDLLGRPEFKDLGVDARLVLRKCQALGDGMFFTAEQDIPEWGVKKDQIAPRYDLIFAMVEADAEMVKTLRAGQAETAKAREINRTATGQFAKAPPAVSAKGSPAVGQKEKTKPRSLSEWEDSLRDA